MAPITEPAPKHVPAWKKLGLKLKYAKEEPDDLHGGQHETLKSKKRKELAESEFTAESSAMDRPTKKPKKSNSHNHRPSEPVNGESTVATPSKLKESSPSAIGATPVNKRKSVAFTPETKTEDGDSVKQLYKTWYSTQLAKDPFFDPSSISPALKTIAPTVTIPDSPTSENTKSSPSPSDSKAKPKKPKQKKKAKYKPVQTSTNSKPHSEHPALTYLTTHYTTHTTWKFSKPHQNHLLKHLFSLTHIPSTHDPALLSYLHGLQGTSARSRIRKQALTIRSEDEEWLAAEPTDAEKMDNETYERCKERKKRDYEAAVKSVKERLRVKEEEREEREWELGGEKAGWEERLRKRRRAEVVLWGVGEDEEIAEDKVALPQQAIAKKDIGGGGEPEFPRGRGRGIGGVEEISAGGIARASQGKKIVFGDEGAGVKQANGLIGVQKMNGKIGGGNEGQAKRKRKRKRRTGVPDDESSSESSSSSSSEESEEERHKPAAGKQVSGKVISNEGQTSSSGSDSDSDSESGLSEDSDSE